MCSGSQQALEMHALADAFGIRLYARCRERPMGTSICGLSGHCSSTGKAVLTARMTGAKRTSALLAQMCTRR